MTKFWKKAHDLFYETPMTWGRVLLFSVITGVAVGGLLCIPGLGDTSLENPGVCFEIWIILALWIILNCQKPVEAGLKTFVFFLISQPLIYLVQVPFSWQGWHLFSYYPYWFFLTVCTFPGGMLAWLVKKQKWYSPIILAVAIALLMGMEFSHHLQTLLSHFPKQLLACLFILTETIFLNVLIFQNKKIRTALFAFSAAAAIGGILLFM